MVDLKENPSLTLSLEGEVIEGLGASATPGRLSRYSEAHHRALMMVDFIKSQKKCKKNLHLAESISTCGSYLVFHDYFKIDETRLVGMTSCKKTLLCPFCAMRRAAKMVDAYLQRLEIIASQNNGLKAYLVTLTVKNGEDLKERFSHLHGSLRKYNDLRRDAKKGNRAPVEFNKALGAVGSFEFKRGQGSGLWHPHYHAVWLCKESPNSHILSQEWKKVTGDSFIVDVREFQDQGDLVGGFLEVFKYALKFSDMPIEQNWLGYELLSGRRLVNSFGLFRGVDVPESNLDNVLMDEPYVELFYRFKRYSGYSINSVSEIVEPVQRLFDGNKRSNLLNWTRYLSEKYPTHKDIIKARCKLISDKDGGSQISYALPIYN
jgi:plasmid rolling circle replication initiator protein Rep